MKLEFEYVKTKEEMEQHIKACEGRHIQQVIYSTYHNALTQICFRCRRVRSTIKEEDLK